MFDSVEIIIKAGDGGNGVVSFRHEKFVPFGGPNGGDGGRGGDVFVSADPAVTSLEDFRFRRYYRAGKGGHGSGKKKHGRAGKDLVLRVPVGTMVSHKTAIGGEVAIADLVQPGQSVVLAKGGRGGWGNTHFVSSINQAPRMAQKGEAGEEKAIILELRLIADVGIIGYPNVGKSTLLSVASAARPKIAGYQFTTRSPALGVVEIRERAFVLAEIPGLLDGAHLGRGLGHDFLRHISRTRVLIHLIDGTSQTPVRDMMKVNAELSLYDSALAQKRQLVAVNKIDVPDVLARRVEIKDGFAAAGIEVFFISALTGEGVPELMAETVSSLDQAALQEAPPQSPVKVFHPRPKGTTPAIHREGGIFVVESPELERLIAGVGDVGPGLRWQLKQQVHRQGIARALARAGVKPGDKVRCGKIEWEWD